MRFIAVDRQFETVLVDDREGIVYVRGITPAVASELTTALHQDTRDERAARLYRYPEAARLLGVCERTLQYWVAHDRVSYMRGGATGRLIFFTHDDIEASRERMHRGRGRLEDLHQ